MRDSMYSDVMRELNERGHIHKMNPLVAEGLAYHQIGENAVMSVDALLRRELGSQNKRLPRGFRYVSYRVYSPEEMYAWQEKARIGGTPKIDVARSNYYLADFVFEMLTENGQVERYNRPLLIPYIDMFNVLTINGGNRLFSSVWHQPGLCYVNDGFFVHFPFSKRVMFKFETSLIKVYGNDERCYLPYSNKLKERKSNGVTNIPLIPYWLYCKYGFSGAIKKYLGVEVLVMWDDDPRRNDLRLDEYNIVESKLGERHERKIVVYVPIKNLGINVSERSSEEKQLLTMITSLFYAYKYQPNFVDPDDIDDPVTWMRVLGYSIEGRNVSSESQLFKEIEKHLTEIERYFCDKFKHEMAITGVTDLENIFDFLFHVIRSTVDLFNLPKSELSSLYGKCLKTIDYMFSGSKGLAKAINTIRWRLITFADKAMEETGDSYVSDASIKTLLNSLYVSIMNKITSGHGEISHLSSTSECVLFGMVTHAIDQTDASKETAIGKKTIDLDDPALHRHASRLEAANYGYVSKSHPFGDIISPWITLGKNYEVVRNPDLIELVDEAQADLAQRGNLR